jgi:hypothetical protein
MLEDMKSVVPRFRIWESEWDPETERYERKHNPLAPPQPCEPCDGVLLGDLDDVNRDKLWNAWVGSVVCLCPEKLEDESLDNQLRADGINFLRIPAEDNASYDILQHLPLVTETIERTRKRDMKTLVQCWAGVNRSAALVVGYMNAHREFTLSEAFRQTVTLRGEVLLNENFRAQLARAARGRGELAVRV